MFPLIHRRARGNSLKIGVDSPAGTTGPETGGTKRDTVTLVYSTDNVTFVALDGETFASNASIYLAAIVDFGTTGDRNTALSEVGVSPATDGSVMEWWLGDPAAGGTLIRADDYFPTYDARGNGVLVTMTELGGTGTPTITARCVYPSDNRIDDHTATITINAPGGGVGTFLSTGYTREALLDERIGFGAGAGGSGDGSSSDALLWTEYVVTNLNDSGAGSLREAMSGSQRWVTFASGLTGDINLNSTITFPSDIVVDGRGASINFPVDQDTVFASGFSTSGSSLKHNFIFAYLSFELVSGAASSDGIQCSGTYDGWMHHLTFTGLGPDNTSDGDGCIDIAHTSGNVDHPDDMTVSYCFFDNWNKTCHWSWTSTPNDGPGTDATKITSAFNRWRECRQRGPLMRGSFVHIVNNWFEDWGISGSGICNQTSGLGEVYAERNIYDAGFRLPAITNSESGIPSTGYSKNVSNWLNDGAYFTESTPANVFNPYGYGGYSVGTVIVNEASLRAVLTAEAGNQGAGA